MCDDAFGARRDLVGDRFDLVIGSGDDDEIDVATS